MEEKTRTVNLTDTGIEYLETVLRSNKLMENNQSLYDPESTSLVHHINQALLAHKMFNKNEDYIVRNNEIVLIYHKTFFAFSNYGTCVKNLT